MDMDGGLQRKYNRLRSLLASDNRSHPSVDVEIQDLRRDIQGSLAISGPVPGLDPSVLTD
jgi:hypothetical protein